MIVAVAIALHARFAQGSVDLSSNPFAPVALVLPLGLVIAAGPYDNPNAEALKPAFQKVQPGASVGALIVNPSRVWPMVAEAGFLWPSRHFTFWMLPAIAWDRANDGPDNPALAALGQQIIKETLDDFRCHPPRLIVVSEQSSIPSLRGIDFDLLEFFGENAEFKAFLENYDRRTAGPNFTLLSARDGWAPSTPPGGCREVRR
jgi:hypothetical protein